MPLIMIEGYTYARVNFRGDLELMFPDGERWGVIGRTNFFLTILILIFTKKKCDFLVSVTKLFTCTFIYWTY